VARTLVIEADGGSRGNPGQSGSGAVVIDPLTGEILAEIGLYGGIASNNVAEYKAMIAGARRALQLDPDAELHIRMDSKLVVEQMSGRWKIKHPDMAELAAEAEAAAVAAEPPVEVPAEAPVETPAETPVEAPVPTPDETPVETPVEAPVEAPTETPAETPVEVPAETPSQSSVPAETGVQTAEAPAAQAAPEANADPSRPRRSGWWSRKG